MPTKPPAEPKADTPVVEAQTGETATSPTPTISPPLPQSAYPGLPGDEDLPLATRLRNALRAGTAFRSPLAASPDGQPFAIVAWRDYAHHDRFHVARCRFDRPTKTWIPNPTQASHFWTSAGIAIGEIVQLSDFPATSIVPTVPPPQ